MIKLKDILTEVLNTFQIECDLYKYDWGKKIGYTDNFDISIDANEFVKAFKNK